MRFQPSTTEGARSRIQIALKKSSAVLLGSVLALGILLCLSVVSSTSNHHVAQMSGHVCTNEGSGPCPSFGEHFSYWQSISTAVVTDSLLLLLVGVALVLLWTVHGSRFAHKNRALFPLLKARINLGLILPRSSLQEAFASGTIHSKAF